MEQTEEPTGDMEQWEQVTWCVGDVKTLLQEKGFAPSDENAWRVIDECGHTFRDRLTEHGWQLLDTYIDITDDLEPEKEERP